MNVSDNYILPRCRSSSASSNKYSSLPKFNNPHPHHQHHYSNSHSHSHSHSQSYPYPYSQSRVSSGSEMHSVNGFPYNRTISSSSSILSTPSNNIKKYQRQRQQENQNQNQQQQVKSTQVIRTSRNTKSVKTKLLNLHQSLKQQLINKISEELLRSGSKPSRRDNGMQLPPHFALGKTEKTTFNCDIYTKSVASQKSKLFLPIRESQVNAWESAESVTRNLVFSNESSDDESENYGQDHGDVIVSIPGYTQGELNMLFKFKNLSNQDEKRLLFEYQRKLLSQQERNLTNGNASLAYRRSLQINQKREIISKMFNNNTNNLNLEYITNNSSKADDILQAISHDAEEINYLLEEDGDFKLLQEEIKQNVFHKKAISNENQLDENKNAHFDYDKFQGLTSKKLDKMHDDVVRQHEEENYSNDEYREPSFYSEDLSNLELDEELLQFTIGHLRTSIKVNTSEENNGDE